MKWQPYPKYKDSGVDWLGEVPEGWRHGSLRWLSRIYAGGTPDKSNPDFWIDGHIPWLNSGAVNQNTITEPSEYITQEGFNYSSAKWIPRYALLMALAGQGKTKGMVAQLLIEATCNQSMAAIIPGLLMDSRYLYWWLTSNYQNIRNLSGGDSRDGLNLVLLGNIPCPIPSKLEQQAIAAFLDRETGRIDELVAKKKALIEKLKEQRTAIISSAVTKGLPPDVAPRYGLAPHTRFKPSGVDWLGDIPEGWKASRLGYETWVRARLGWKGLKADEYVDEGCIFLATPNIKNRDIDFINVNYITQERYDESPEIKLKQGDVLLAKDGSTLGTVNIVRFLPDEATVNSSIAVITPYEELNGVYLMYLFLSKFIINTIQRVKGGIGVPHLFQSDLNKFYIPLPLLQEQQAIAAYLDEQTTKIDNLISKVEQAIRTLQEYRSALITAAVTGKIDVRHEVPMQEVS